MAAQIVDGYAWMHRNMQKYFRAEANPGVVDDQVIADGITMGERMIHDEVMASHVHWCVKSTTIDDLGGDLGTQYDFQTRILMIEEDLGITDFAKASKLWRVDASQASTPAKIHYISDDSGDEYVRDTGSLIGPTGEFWDEHGKFNSLGNWEVAFRLYNWGTSKENGHLRVDYWWAPPMVDPDWFEEVDSSGNLTKAPPFPRPMWPYILEYAKWVTTEVTGDIDKQRALARRWKSRGGIQERVREFLGQFQSGGPEYVQDSFRAEGI